MPNCYILLCYVIYYVFVLDQPKLRTRFVIVWSRKSALNPRNKLQMIFCCLRDIIHYYE